jgi:hypothetical protein
MISLHYAPTTNDAECLFVHVRSPRRDQPANPVASRAAALRAFDPKKIEVSGDVGEHECAVVRHGRKITQRRSQLTSLFSASKEWGHRRAPILDHKLNSSLDLLS